MVLLYMVCHGSHPYTPFMLAYMPAPWILFILYLRIVDFLKNSVNLTINLKKQVKSVGNAIFNDDSKVCLELITIFWDP